jgi:hypothetical protein
MTFLTVERANQNTADGNGVSKALDEVFIAAILLTGCTELAERAVGEAIETLGDNEISEDMVLRGTISAAVTPEMMAGNEGSRQPQPTVSWLPVPLRRVLLLPRNLRQAFVLRLLLGMPRDRCSQLLRLDERKLDEHVRQAAIFLSQGHSFTDRPRWAQHSTL